LRGTVKTSREAVIGIGDNLMGSGLARGACMRGVRIAFGDGKRIIWDQHSAAIFSRNPNIAPPGSESEINLEWMPFYKGNRLYNQVQGRRWIWNYDFKAIPGDVYLTFRERSEARRYGLRRVVIEPHVAAWKSTSINKDWGFARYQAVADALSAEGHHIIQFVHNREPRLEGVTAVPTRTFRDGLAVLHNAALYIGPEGGLHHGAAAVGIPAVVLFGGFVPPAVTGYASHVNLTGGADEACGSFDACPHCIAAMDAISIDEVVAAAREKLKR
jgi:ADP-heptose:LPS heptosyltransferase